MNIFIVTENYAFFRGDIIKNIVKTVASVTVFSCVERFIGFLYRIFLSRNLGAEILGVYQITLSIVGVLVTLTASGIPITVSRLMIKEKSKNNPLGEKEVVSAGIFTSLLISLPLCLILYFFKDTFSFIFADSRCYDLLVIILPGVVITSVYAVIRGFFWGNCNFFTYSLIELIEEAAMCVAGVILVKKSTSLWNGALSAAQSVFISYVVSFLLSTTVFTLKNGKLANPVKQLKPLIASASPITAMRTLTSGISSLIAIIIPARLVEFGMTSAKAMEAFGELSGMTLPLLFIPSTIIGSIALVVVPKLSESYYKKEKTTLNEGIDRSIDYSLFISCLIIPVFISAGKQIGVFIYDNQNAGAYLAVSAIIMLPMSLTMITNSVLNSLNKERNTLINFVIGAALMIGITYFLPKFTGIYALILSYFVSYVVNGLLNLLTLSKITSRGKYYLKSLLKAIFATGVGTALGVMLENVLNLRISNFLLILTVGVATAVFSLLMALVLGLIDFKKLLKN